MAKRHRSKAVRKAEKDAYQASATHFLYASKEFDLQGERREYVARVVADAMGLPDPKTEHEVADTLRLFWHQEPKHRSVNRSLKTAKSRPAPRKAPNVNSDAFLLSFEWRKLRMEVLVERGARCECCGATPAANGIVIHVDHIKPRRFFPALALNKSNLQVLCEVCNHGKGAWSQKDWRAESRTDDTPTVAVSAPRLMPRLVRH